MNDTRSPSGATSYAVVAVPEGVRLTIEPGPVVEFSHTDAEAVGSVLKAVARETRSPDPIERMRADRDALDAAINILHRPLDNA